MKNLIEVPKIDFDFITFDFNIKNNIEDKLKSLTDSLPTLPQVNLRVPEVSIATFNTSLEAIRKLELYEYLLRTLQNLLFVFNTISWFTQSVGSLSLTTQINSTISNIYCFISQIMEIINFSNKKTWAELKHNVSEIRKKISSLSYSVPTNVQFRELADGRIRIYFLCESKSETLLYVDINTRKSENESSLLQWMPVFSKDASTITSFNASRELQLLLERKRLPVMGINSYEFHKKSGKIIFQACNSLYMCLDTGFNTTPLFPTELRTCQQYHDQNFAPIDPKICPQNSDLIAYTCGNDIYVTHSISGHDQRLTFSHGGKRNDPRNPVSAGVPSYVMQEEFNRYEAFWWQPTSNDGIYRICFEEVDESDVSIFTFPSAHAGEREEYRFPRAGCANARSALKMVEFRLSESLRITDICIKEMQTPLNFIFPYLEYIVRIGWANADYIWAQLLSRQQQFLELVLIPLDQFSCESYNSNPSSPESLDRHVWKPIVERSSNPIQVIYTERSNQWINVHDLLHFLDVSDNFVSFIWSSEETGFRHLYHVISSIETKKAVKSQNQLQLQNGLRTHYAFCDDTPMDENLKARIVKKVALTSGEWEVLGKNIWIDQSRNLIYFMSTAHSVLEKHLYVLNITQPNKLKLLTVPGSTNSIELNEDCSLIVKTHSNTNQLPSTEILRVHHSNLENASVDDIELVHAGYLSIGSFDSSEYTPQIFEVMIESGDVLYALVFKPHNFKPGMVYPTVLSVYGGPEVQVVSNSFKGMRQLRMHMLASQGYCVISIDSRGSKNRGLLFENYIRRRLGLVELADQVEVLRNLSKQLGFIDLNRVAIHGWSYGGYLSLMGLVQYPDLFKVAIAGAPVTSWNFYDTGYTERYMDLPENNHEGYEASSVLSYVHKFPDEANRLLLIHGLIDENVHFYHTSQLISHLIRANKPYSLQVYPNERHSLRSIESSKHYETYLLQYLQDNL